MKEQTTTLEYPKFEFLDRHIKNRIHTFSSRKAYQTRKITNENAKALFSNAKNCVLPTYKRYASILVILKISNFFVTTLCVLKNIILVLLENLENLRIINPEVTIW